MAHKQISVLNFQICWFYKFVEDISCVSTLQQSTIFLFLFLLYFNDPIYSKIFPNMAT